MTTSTPRELPGVVTLGETMAQLRSGQVGSLAHLDQLAIGIAGAESNVAIGLRRLGVPTTWLGRVGADDLGRRIARELRAEDVRTLAIQDDGAPTGLMLKSRPTSITTAVDYYRAGSAGSRLEPTDLPPDLLGGAEILHVTGITPALSASARDTLHAAIDRARAQGVRVSFDVNHRSRLIGTAAARDAYRAIAARADLVFGGPEELGLLTDSEAATSEDAAAVLPEGCEVVLKDGERGAASTIGGTTLAVAAHPVAVVDTVGAGDAFVAGYLSAVVQGLDPLERLRRGAICGAVACMSPGDWEGAPFLADLDGVLGAAGDPVRR